MLEEPFARRVLDWSTDVSIINNFEIVVAEEEIAGSSQDRINLVMTRGFGSGGGGGDSSQAGKAGGEEQTTKVKVDVSGNKRWSATQEHMTGMRGKHNTMRNLKSRRRGKRKREKK